MNRKPYGVVYTSAVLADFVAHLLYKVNGNHTVSNILDPACGEGALLCASKNYFGNSVNYYGIDVDANAISSSPFCTFNYDSILPDKIKGNVFSYWKTKLPKIDAVIANPPWSSEKIYDRKRLNKAGFTLIDGQYDSYVLFIEWVYNVIDVDCSFAFIIPDSIFDEQNRVLRKFLLQNTQIQVIARLGEKLFKNVNRATTVIICKKTKPQNNTETICFRLSTSNRNSFLRGDVSLFDVYNLEKHKVKQSRFLENANFEFDIDLYEEEEHLLNKIKKDVYDLSDVLRFSRGVEISKSGSVVVCPHCGYTQGFSKSQLASGIKTCKKCDTDFYISEEDVIQLISSTDGDEPIIVGEDVHRYDIKQNNYIKLDYDGVNYKEPYIYKSPKILFRKTGLGIYATVDYLNSITSQTVYILSSLDNSVPLEYITALINSRVVYYFYLKMYGENEWKSHPYFTKSKIFSLPIKKYENSKLDNEIVSTVKKLFNNYSYDQDIKLERLIMSKYGLSYNERQSIMDEINSLPNLGAINDMKAEVTKVV